MLNSLKGVISINYYNQIKEELVNNEVYKKAKDYSKNRSDLATYYNVGKIIIEAQGGEDKSEYGNKLIKEYSLRLTKELGKGYSTRNLYNMRLFYLKFKESKILHALPAKLSWSHLSVLLSVKNYNELNYYIKITEEQNLPYRELQKRIKNKEYERLDEKTKEKLITKEENKIEDFIKNPIIIKIAIIMKKYQKKY